MEKSKIKDQIAKFKYPIPFFLIVFLACQAKEEKAKTSLKSEEEVRGVKIVESEWGQKSWELLGERIERQGDTTRVYNFELYFFDSKGEKSSTLTADSGLVFEKVGDMMALGKVKVITNAGAKLETTSLNWKEKEQLIVTEDEVFIEKEGKLIHGKGLKSDPELKHIDIKGEITGSDK